MILGVFQPHVLIKKGYYLFLKKECSSSLNFLRGRSSHQLFTAAVSIDKYSYKYRTLEELHNHTDSLIYPDITPFKQIVLVHGHADI